MNQIQRFYNINEIAFQSHWVCEAVCMVLKVKSNGFVNR